MYLVLLFIMVHIFGSETCSAVCYFFFQSEVGNDGGGGGLALTRDEFCDAVVRLVNKGTKDEVRELCSRAQTGLRQREGLLLKTNKQQQRN